MIGGDNTGDGRSHRRPLDGFAPHQAGSKSLPVHQVERRLADRGGGLAGTVVQDKRQLLFFKGKEAVNLWKSSLTRRLNRADLLGSHRLTGDGVYASDGVMFETRGGRTWHRGTSVVSTSAGQRTITHLQSLNLPAQHYYFNSRIGDEQAVGIATGRIDPRKVPGFVGGISPGEALCPGWAGAKRAMINSVLYWGERKA